jgi:ABC-type transport system involved in cytochrome c biogenesis permease subunit
MNFQLLAIILLVILYPVGFRMANPARMREASRNEMLAGLLVLLLFLVSGIYLLISSWVLFLMMLGSGVLLIAGTAAISLAPEMSQKARDFPETYAYLRGRVKGVLFFGLLLIGGGIYVFVLSIIRCLG